MKKLLVLAVFFAAALPLVISGCQTEEKPNTTPSTVPAFHGGQPAMTVEYSTDEFAAQNHIIKDVQLTAPGSLIVTLGANPTTGYQWASDVIISDPSVIGQASHNYIAPPTATGTVGAPGKDVWVFNSLKAGTGTISMSYSRPWAGGEKDTWTLILKVTVK